ncbi:hypothetical protein EVAR_99167_1 [Eumeta japonica]|uniref:Uncharacterized protein n=1 Tax=Eumeta variegata TaxID=151549 RepID=A0A4C1S9D8_EUMVA|nr:hypothetical protein EVAR_99167_1 [Eumeta japonica]
MLSHSKARVRTDDTANSVLSDFSVDKENNEFGSPACRSALTTTDTIQLPQSGCWLSRTDANERKICVSPETRTRRAEGRRLEPRQLAETQRQALRLSYSQ